MRLALLAHDKFGPQSAKTAMGAIVYSRNGWSGDDIACVIDRSKAGRDAGEFLGEVAKGIPIVASAAEAIALTPPPDALVIGIAPVGGALPADWRADLDTALDAGMRVVSGLHTALKPDFPRHAHLVRDVRHEHPPQRITTGEGMFVDALVVTFAGTDCNSGKMTSAVELAREARRRGLKAAFVATGQTGIMIGCDAGAPLDALVSDFVAGATEELVLQAAQKEPDIIFVEGQGTLTHPAYSGVTASLLHGSFPDVVVLADEPRRQELRMPPGPVAFPKPSLAFERALNETHLQLTSRGRVGAVALMTPGVPEAEYRETRDRIEKELGLAAGDVFRGEAGRILDGVLATAREMGLWDNGGLKRGVKPARRPKQA
ncbi:MAG TPA: DUF1611 domain-containing protein [Candidatus Thermoplasmatota archaeon]|nr:DUF1611 domain-containing protein [Candidatus Thermoplasmatota archaeon]